MKKNSGQMESEVRDFLEGWAGVPGEVVCLKGDASTRRYYRLQGFGREGAVLMFTGEPFGEKERAFLGVRDFLETIGVPVPAVFEVFPPKGIILMEDLGDTSLRQYLEGGSADDRRAVMLESLEILIRMQKEGTRMLGPDCPAYHTRFDAGIFYGELRFFHEHFLEAVAAVPGSLEAELDGLYRGVAEDLSGYSRNTFCHRDYHVDNLFFHKGKVWVIDFQDARIGPPAYDLASLLTDRNMRSLLGDALRDALFDGYVGGMEPEAEAFEHQYALAAVQRCLKATGTFGYQSLACGNLSYGAFIPAALAEFGHEVKKLEKYGESGEQLLRIVPEKWK